MNLKTEIIEVTMSSRGHLNLKMPSYHYRNSHYKDKTVMRLSYFPNGNPLPGKTLFILKKTGIYFRQWHSNPSKAVTLSTVVFVRDPLRCFTTTYSCLFTTGVLRRRQLGQTKMCMWRVRCAWKTVATRHRQRRFPHPIEHKRHWIYRDSISELVGIQWEWVGWKTLPISAIGKQDKKQDFPPLLRKHSIHSISWYYTLRHLPYFNSLP